MPNSGKGEEGFSMEKGKMVFLTMKTHTMRSASGPVDEKISAF